MNQYNDYELLYLMNEFDEEAERIFYEKYSYLIKARIYKFNIKERYKEDFYQEGLYMLLVASRTYDIFSDKSFNKYFDLILQRRFVRLISQEKRSFYDVEFNDIEYFVSERDDFMYDQFDSLELSELEEKVYILKKRNYRPKEIASILGCDIKSVYNCLCRIKNKYNV